jgi:uncharacterized membrane protein
VPDETVQSGLTDNNAGALAYITIIPAIVFLVAAPYNQSSYIRFHAWQSIFLCIALFAVSIIAVVPILGWIVYAVGAIAIFIGWIMCILKALKGERFKLPFIGDLAAKQAGA